MTRLIGLWLVGCALCVTPVAADEDMYDGSTAIRPLTVKPQPQHSVPPNIVCDFEHQCYPEKGGPANSAPVDPPAIVVKPVAPRSQVPDEPVVAKDMVVVVKLFIAQRLNRRRQDIYFPPPRPTSARLSDCGRIARRRTRFWAKCAVAPIVPKRASLNASGHWRSTATSLTPMP